MKIGGKRAYVAVISSCSYSTYSLQSNWQEGVFALIQLSKPHSYAIG